MPKQGDQITLANPQRGIAPSPYLGIADIRNCDIYSEPGVLKINQRSLPCSNDIDTSTFTADDGTDVITTANNFMPDRVDTDFSDDETALGRAVTLTTTGTLPAGLSLSTVYFLIDVNGLTTFKLATTYDNAVAGTAIDITDTGSGVHTITSIEMARPEQETTDPTTGKSFIVDSTGRVWKNVGSSIPIWRLMYGNTLTNATGQGLVAAYDCLFVFRATVIDVMVIATGVWTNSWKTDLISATRHRPFLKDSIIYFGNDRYVGSIEEVGTFVPGTGSTYTYDAQVLDLPKGYVIGPITELGSKLVPFATRSGESRAFPWSTLATDSYDGDFPVPGATVYDAKNILNTIYIASGDDGCIYSTVGTVAYQFFQVPSHISNIPSSNAYARIRQLEFFRNRIFFSLDCIGASGVWSVDITTKRLALENRVSAGSYGTVSGVFIPLLHKPTTSVLHIGWENKETSPNVYGLDTIGEGNFTYYKSYSAYLIFELLRVGNYKNSSTPTEILFQLAQALASGHGVRLSYRKDLSSSFTVIGTYDYSTISSALSWFADSNISLAEVLQIKVELTTADQTTPKFHSIILS